ATEKFSRRIWNVLGLEYISLLERVHQSLIVYFVGSERQHLFPVVGRDGSAPSQRQCRRLRKQRVRRWHDLRSHPRHPSHPMPLRRQSRDSGGRVGKVCISHHQPNTVRRGSQVPAQKETKRSSLGSLAERIRR